MDDFTVDQELMLNPTWEPLIEVQVSEFRNRV